MREARPFAVGPKQAGFPAVVVRHIVVLGPVCRRLRLLIGYFVACHSMVGWNPADCDIVSSVQEPGADLHAGDREMLTKTHIIWADSVYGCRGVHKDRALMLGFLPAVQW